MPDTSLRLKEAFSLQGQIALVTGGGTGIGFAISEAFLAAGARVAITGRRFDVLREAATTLGSGVSAFEHDVTDEVSTAVVMERVEREVGTPTILVNNAGIHFKRPICETSAADFHRMMATHVEGAFAVTRAAIPGMRRQGRGSVLFMASMTSLIGIADVVAYSAAKAAYLGMVRALAVELGPQGIRVNAIAPGWIETPMLHLALDGDPARKAKILSRTPQGRFGEPNDLGWSAVYLSSPAAAFVNGVVLPVDGGASIGF